MQSHPEHISRILTRRKDFIELVCIAAILALGINLLAGLLLTNEWLPRQVSLYLAISLILGALIWILVISFPARTYSKQFGAFFLLDQDNNLIAVDDYDFSFHLAKTVHAVLKENAAFQSLWSTSPLVARGNSVGQSIAAVQDGKRTSKPAQRPPSYVAMTRFTQTDDYHEPDSAALLREAIEYLVLDELSTHLSTYFNEYSDEDKYIREYQRKDIPTLLLDNRVLELLSTPFEQRAAFVNLFKDEKDKPHGEIVKLYALGGEFSRFDLVLPAETSVARPEPGTIAIENNRFVLTITAEYHGYGAVVPDDFMSLYLRRDPRNLDARQATITIEYKIKALSLLRRSGWEYYRWVDSFAAAIEKSYSMDSFFQRIQWDSLSVLFRVLRGRELAQIKATSPPRVKKR